MPEEVLQLLITPAAGKRLIAKSMLRIVEIQEAIKSRTVVIVAGTTNGYVAEEVLKSIGQEAAFSRERFFRGITLPPEQPVTGAGRMPEAERRFAGDVVIEKGEWLSGKTIFDVIDGLKAGDVIIKGANALDTERGKAGVLIGDSKAGTISAALQAVYGRRVSLYIPVGLEKRITGDIEEAAKLLNSPGTAGARLMPVSGVIVTELTAIGILTGCEAVMSAAGGVCGAEGGVWIAARGTEEQIENLRTIYRDISREPGFSI